MNKFKKGAQITSMASLEIALRGGNKQWIYLNHKAFHPGWITSMQYRCLNQFIERGHVWLADDNLKGVYYNTARDFIFIVGNKFAMPEECLDIFGIFSGYIPSCINRTELKLHIKEKRIIKLGDL